MEYVVTSADVMGIHANGSSAEEAVDDFRRAVKTRLANKQGELYPGASDCEFQERYFLNLEQGWKSDSVIIIGKR